MDAGMCKESQEVNRILHKLINDVPELQQMFGRSPRFRYFLHRAKGHQERWYMWTTERDGQGKFISGVYHTKGTRMVLKERRAHKRRKDAKARALKLYRKRAADLGAKNVAP